jgi:hypothetical protein
MGAVQRTGNRVSTAGYLGASSLPIDPVSLGTRRLARVNNERPLDPQFVPLCGIGRPHSHRNSFCGSRGASTPCFCRTSTRAFRGLFCRWAAPCVGFLEPQERASPVLLPLPCTPLCSRLPSCSFQAEVQSSSIFSQARPGLGRALYWLGCWFRCKLRVNEAISAGDPPAKSARVPEEENAWDSYGLVWRRSPIDAQILPPA